MINDTNDNTTPLVPPQSHNAISALQQAQALRMQRRQTNTTIQEAPTTTAHLTTDQGPTPPAPTYGERQGEYGASINDSQVRSRPQNGSYRPPDAINNTQATDDHYHRAGSAAAQPSPFDYNPNPGSDLPAWRQFGYESEEAYRVATHEARIQEQLAAYRQGQPVPQANAPAHADRSFMDRFFGDPAQGADNNAPQGDGNDEQVPMGHQPRQPQNNVSSARQRFVKINRFELIKMGCFASLVLINLFALPDIKTGCKFESTFFNAIFLYACLIPETILRVIFRFFLLSDFEERMWRRNQILKAVTGVLYAVFAIYVLRTFETFTVHCYDPYPSFSLFTFSVIICFILPQAFIVCCIATMFILFLPCICYWGINFYRTESELQQNRQGVIDSTPKVAYDQARFDSIKNCTICLIDFNQGDQVTPLPCDMRHCYHYECIISWFNTKVECPQCRRQFTMNDMQYQTQNMQQIIDTYAAQQKIDKENQV